MERFHEERGRKREREIRLMKIKMEREGCRENVRESEREWEIHAFCTHALLAFLSLIRIRLVFLACCDDNKSNRFSVSSENDWMVFIDRKQIWLKMKLRNVVLLWNSWWAKFRFNFVQKCETQKSSAQKWRTMSWAPGPRLTPGTSLGRWPHGWRGWSSPSSSSWCSFQPSVQLGKPANCLRSS